MDDRAVIKRVMKVDVSDASRRYVIRLFRTANCAASSVSGGDLLQGQGFNLPAAKLEEVFRHTNRHRPISDVPLSRPEVQLQKNALRWDVPVR